MRSSAIAEELIKRGEDVVFVGRISDLSWVEERIASLGFSYICDYSTEFNSKSGSDVLILDSYKIDIRDDFVKPENWLHIVTLVDEFTPDYRCTLRIHPGLDAEWVGKSETPILAGPKYIPLRSSLSDYIHAGNDVQNSLKIAVVAGGSDPFGLVHKIANILAKIPEQFEVFLFSSLNSDSTLDSRFKYFEPYSDFDVSKISILSSNDEKVLSHILFAHRIFTAGAKEFIIAEL
jgi:spore coat polysaccharide biosynthesis predicted glycosyltransferase SpsG